MNIALLGGSFNPPHIGHLLVAQQVLDFGRFDALWFVPDYIHSFDKPLAPFKHRVSMLEQISLGKTSISTLMADHEINGNTIKLVPILHEKYPKDSFTFIIGSDQLPTFHKWGQWEVLLQKLPFLVAPRAGYPLVPLYNGMRVLEHDFFITTNISSSMVRARLKAKLSITYLVPEKVCEYIEKQRLYTSA